MNAVLEALTRLGFDWHVALANTVNFFIIFFVLKHFFFGSIQKTLNERKNKIEKGISDASEARAALETAEENKKSIIKQAEIKASDILAGVDTKGKELLRSIAAEAETKGTDIINSARTAADKISTQSENELRAKVPALACEMVEKILKTKMTKEENDMYVSRLLTNK